MRVLWVYEALSPQWCAVAAELDRQPDIELQIMSGSPLPPEIAHLAVSQVSCRSKIDFRARLQIRAQLRAEQYDVAHAYSSRNMANLAAACWHLRGAPQLVGYRGTVDRLSRWDPANYLTFWHSRFSRINCVCHATRAALQDSGVPARRLETVWEGCDPQLLWKRPRSLLAEFQIPADAFVVGTVANARRVKGLDIMLRAAIDLSAEQDLYWLVVGKIVDPLVDKLAHDPGLQGRVKLIGSQPSGGGFCGLLDVYVAPSRKEGLSMGIMEAMSQGVCPVVTNVGGNSELIRDRVDGIVIPPESPEALGRAIAELRNDVAQRRRYAAAAQQRAQEVFSISAWTTRLLQVYRRLVDGESRHQDHLRSQQAA